MVQETIIEQTPAPSGPGRAIEGKAKGKLRGKDEQAERKNNITFSAAFMAVARWLWWFVRYAISFRWVVDITRGLIKGGGFIAESAFLLATTYVIINVVAHPLVLWALNNNTDVISSFNQIAMIAFSILPELIAASAIVMVFTLWRSAYLTRRLDFLMWAILYTVPTVIFAVMTIRLINQFVSLDDLQQVFKLSPDDLHWRVNTGWAYGVLQMVYAKLGEETLSKAFAELRDKIKQIETEKVQLIADWGKEKEALNGEIEKLKGHLARSKQTEREILTELNKSSDAALEAYGQEVINWLNSGVKSVSKEDITKFTGHSKRKIDNALEAGKLRNPPRNTKGNLVLIDSLTEWLKDTPPPDRSSKTGEQSAIKLVNNEEVNTGELAAVDDKLTLTIEAMSNNPNITDEELAVILNIKRPASARFWKLKAQEILRVAV